MGAIRCVPRTHRCRFGDDAGSSGLRLLDAAIQKRHLLPPRESQFTLPPPRPPARGCYRRSGNRANLLTLRRKVWLMLEVGALAVGSDERDVLIGFLDYLRTSSLGVARERFACGKKVQLTLT